MSNRPHGKSRPCHHKSEFHKDPLALSNPFLKLPRRAAFEETVGVLTKQFPDATVAWVRKNAWARARKIPIPRKPRAS